MKKIIVLLLVILLGGNYSCHNAEWEFPDFDYTTVYFPNQFPIRTLVLGDYVYNNDNDNNLKFIISSHLGGMYENRENQFVDYIIDPGLIQNLMTEAGDTLATLPSDYYTIAPTGQFVIPEGKFYAGFEVQLTDSFLDDSMAHQTHYVLPAKITSSSLDSILSGKPFFSGADPRIPEQWDIMPKDYTLFAIKYINPYHGKYLHRGRSIIFNAFGNPKDTIIYRNKYIVHDEIWFLKTAGRNKVSISGTIRASEGSPGNLLMDLNFDASSGEAIISNSPDSDFAISGNGQFVQDGDMWGNENRNAIYLNYQINVGSDIHKISDTLVIRDRDVRFETFIPKIYEE